MPRRAPALAALLQKYLLIHEPYVRSAPQFRDYIGSLRFLEQSTIASERIWIEQVLVKLRGRLGSALELRRVRTRMAQTPLKRIARQPHRIVIERAANQNGAIAAKFFSQRIQILQSHLQAPIPKITVSFSITRPRFPVILNGVCGVKILMPLSHATNSSP